jgi:hypothetical protein
MQALRSTSRCLASRGDIAGEGGDSSTALRFAPFRWE